MSQYVWCLNVFQTFSWRQDATNKFQQNMSRFVCRGGDRVLLRTKPREKLDEAVGLKGDQSHWPCRQSRPVCRSSWRELCNLRSHLTARGKVRFNQELWHAKSQFKLFAGYDAPYKKDSMRAIGGKHIGVGFMTTFPCRPIHSGWHPELPDTYPCGHLSSPELLHCRGSMLRLRPCTWL